MRKDLEEKFEAIIETTITEAEDVECSFDEFVEGLKSMRIRLNERFNQARDEQDTREEDTLDDEAEDEETES